MPEILNNGSEKSAESTGATDYGILTEMKDKFDAEKASQQVEQDGQKKVENLNAEHPESEYLDGASVFSNGEAQSVDISENDDSDEEWNSDGWIDMDDADWEAFNGGQEWVSQEYRQESINQEKIEVPKIRLLEDIQIDDYMKSSYQNWVNDLLDDKRKRIVAGEKTEDAQKEAMQIYYSLDRNRHRALPAIIEADSDIIEQMSDDLHFFADEFDKIDDLDKTRGNRDLYKSVITSYYEFYRENGKYSNSLRQSISNRILKEMTSEGKLTVAREIGNGIEVQSRSKTPNAFDLYCNFYKELKEDPNDFISRYQTKSDLLRDYCKGHGVSEQTIKGFKANVLPMIEMKDPDVESLQKSSNSWGTVPGDFGISDFTIHALTIEVNPKNIRDLMQIYREIPTSDCAKFEQNRQDALALQGVLWNGRDFIHDERPGIHELFSAMIKYYDSKDDKEAHNVAIHNLRKIVENIKDPQNNYVYSGFDGEKCFDLSAYEQEIAKTIQDGNQEERQYDEPAIKILRRLEENTRQLSLEKPETGDEILDNLLGKLHAYERPNGEVLVDFKQISEIVARTNDILTDNSGRIGMRPSFVKALSYIERMSTFAIRVINGKDYRELPFDPGFKEICKFSEMTSSNEKFDERGFETFWDNFISISSKDWPDQIANGYQALAQRVTKRVNALAQQYRKDNEPRYMIDSLWSGNLNHELIGMVDPR